MVMHMSRRHYQKVTIETRQKIVDAYKNGEASKAINTRAYPASLCPNVPSRRIVEALDSRAVTITESVLLFIGIPSV
jgi:ribosomal protein L34E